MQISKLNFDIYRFSKKRKENLTFSVKQVLFKDILFFFENYLFSKKKKQHFLAFFFRKHVKTKTVQNIFDFYKFSRKGKVFLPFFGNKVHAKRCFCVFEIYMFSKKKVTFSYLFWKSSTSKKFWFSKFTCFPKKR